MKYIDKCIPNELLRVEREERHWSQEELASKLGVDNVRTVKRWEKGTHLPHPEHCRKLEEIFGKDIRALGWGNENDIPYKHIPYARNIFFTGRQDVLEQLYETFERQNRLETCPPQVLTGLAGIGKTHIVTEYAYRYLKKYHTIALLHANTLSVLFSEFASISILLNLPQQREQGPELAIEAVRAWLKKRKYWLLVFDNVDSPQTIEAITEQLLPSPCLGHVLFTTRLQALGPLVHKLEIAPMKTDEAVYFFLRRSKSVAFSMSLSAISEAQFEQASAIVQRLGGLPLALDQAAAYVEDTSCSLTEYLDQLVLQPGLLLGKRGQYTGGHPEPIATTWSISFKALNKRSRTSIELLTFCSFLDPDGIPEELFPVASEELGPILQSLIDYPLEWHYTLEELLKYSFIQHHHETKTYTIHRLVQVLVREQLDQQVQRLYAVRTVRAIHRVFPAEETSSWELCQRYLPQAQLCAEWITHYQLVFLEAAQLLDRVGYYLYKRGRYAGASSFLHQAHSLKERLAEPEHPETAISLNNLALLYQSQGKYEQAEALFQRALMIREQTLGSEHLDTAVSLNNLAEFYAEQGKYEQAEPLFLRALGIRERVLESEHSAIAISLNSLAVLYGNQGKYEQAETFALRALKIKENVLGREHPDVAETLSNLAGFYHTEGRYEQTEPLYRRALAIFEMALGPEHPNTAISLDNLAGLYVDQGKYEQAELLSQRALMITEKALGKEHPEVSRCLITLALAYQAQKKYEQAESLYQRTLAIYEKAFGPEHPFTAGSLSYLAEIYTEQKKYEQAEALSQRALTIKEKTLGPEHPSTATTLYNLAEVYLAYRKYEQAEALCRRALMIREKALHPQHLDIRASRTILATIQRNREEKTQQQIHAREKESQDKTH